MYSDGARAFKIANPIIIITLLVFLLVCLISVSFNENNAFTRAKELYSIYADRSK